MSNFCVGVVGVVRSAPGRAQANSASSSSTSSDSRGKVLGKVVHLNFGEKNQCMKVTCFLHAKCTFMRQVSKLASGMDEGARRWLAQGTEFPDRKDAAKHLASVDLFLPKAIKTTVSRTKA